MISSFSTRANSSHFNWRRNPQKSTMTSSRGMLHLFGILILLGLYGRAASEPVPVGSVIMKIVNKAGSPIELFWVNVFEKSRPLVKQTTKPIRNNSDTTINSYDGHQFILKFLNPPEGLDPEVPFTKGPKEEVITVTYTPEGGLNTTSVTKFDELLIKVKAQTSNCTGLKGDAFDFCFTQGIAEDVIKMENKRDEVVKYRDLMSSRLRNYTCADDRMNSSKPISSKTVYVNNDIKYKLDILFDSPAAKIWTIEDFITPEECQILYDHGKPRLRRATVAGEDGRSLVSESRKAQQASYNLVDNNPNDPLRGLKERVLSITNHHAGYDLQPDGQEDFTIIQYNKADEYVPHCDGNCDGTPYKLGGRVATAVMYCQAATKGGGTTFTKADVYVKPKAGMATFFSYKGPDGIMEDGFTEHSGCPVLEGEKWITTAWMREGVSLESPSTVFDPSGMRIDNLDPMDREDGGDDEEEEAEEMTQSSSDVTEGTPEDTVEETVEATVSVTATAAVTVEDAPQIVDIEQESPKGWIGGIVGGLSSWKSQFGKKAIQSDL